jgi:hypothetical protein
VTPDSFRVLSKVTNPRGFALHAGGPPYLAVSQMTSSRSGWWSRPANADLQISYAATTLVRVLKFIVAARALQRGAR